MSKEINRLKDEIDNLKEIKKHLKSEIIELDDRILFQEFGIYQPQYNFAHVDQYKERLEKIREDQKNSIKTGNAVFIKTNWKVNGSEKEGKKFTNDSVKLMIRNFNTECDIAIDKVKFSNYESTKNKILRAYETQNKLNEANKIEIRWEYYKSKIEELDLSYEYQQKKQQEREQLRIEREKRREDAKVLLEIEEKRKEYEKEQTHYHIQMKRVNEQLEVESNKEKIEYLNSKKSDLMNALLDIDVALKDIDYREANHKAGYVYIISNIGAFGENVYKIGMTRRLEPKERIAELSGASVPFRYDIHAMIFTDDAPKLESQLHNAFSDKRLNLVNSRKEFFRVRLDEIKKVVFENYDKTVEFTDFADAEQFRTTEMIARTYKV